MILTLLHAHTAWHNRPHGILNRYTRVPEALIPSLPYSKRYFRLRRPSHASFLRRNTFTSLSEVTRSAILEAAVGEIVLMLEQNILAKFKATPEMKKREQRKLVEIGE